jgi:hypothetical protein
VQLALSARSAFRSTTVKMVVDNNLDIGTQNALSVSHARGKPRPLPRLLPGSLAAPLGAFSHLHRPALLSPRLGFAASNHYTHAS